MLRRFYDLAIIYLGLNLRLGLTFLCHQPPWTGHYEMIAGVCPSVCRVLRPNSRTERPINWHDGSTSHE